MSSASPVAAPRALSAQQRRVLAWMEIDVYQGRLQPAPASGASLPADDPLARALARAGGCAEVADWCVAWLAAGHPLPDLHELRTRPVAKRALWRLMRGHAAG